MLASNAQPALLVLADGSVYRGYSFVPCSSSSSSSGDVFRDGCVLADVHCGDDAVVHRYESDPGRDVLALYERIQEHSFERERGPHLMASTRDRGGCYRSSRPQNCGRC